MSQDKVRELLEEAWHDYRKSVIDALASEPSYKSYSIDPETMVAYNRPIEGFIHVVEASALELSGTHTCHTECPRLECVQRREIERLKAKLETHNNLVKLVELIVGCSQHNGSLVPSEVIDEMSEALAQIRESR
jgi:hypothetical protein